MRVSKDLKKRLTQAGDYDQWREAALAVDQATGGEVWRAKDDGPGLAGELLRTDIARLSELVLSGNLAGLAQVLHESLSRHQSDITAPHLYEVALAGTKHIVEDYFKQVSHALNMFVDAPGSKKDLRERREQLLVAQKNLGGPALLLSGGAAMGFFHLGVVKALFEQDLLPQVICGSSIGSLIGGGVCARNDNELSELFADLDTIYRFGIQFLSPRQAWRQKGFLDQQQYERCARENMGDLTFAQAAAHSGRHLCVSVSPARARQKPRVLSAATSPDVSLVSAVVASSAIPALFPPVTLQVQGQGGEVRDYLPGELWVDGTFQGDLPIKRLGRVYNVNQFIVSQVNPHAVPFLASRGGSGAGALAADLVLSSARVQAVQALKVVQARVKQDVVYNALENAKSLAEQDYRGDINIHPPLSAWMYRKMFSNPSVDDLKRYIRMGEQAAWPKMALIRNQTRVQREIGQVILEIEKKMASGA